MYFDELATLRRNFQDNRNPKQQVIEILRREREAERIEHTEGLWTGRNALYDRSKDPSSRAIFVFCPHFGLLPINITLDSLRKGDFLIFKNQFF